MPEPIRIGTLPLFVRPPIVFANPNKQSVSYNADWATEQTYQISLASQQGQKVFGLPQCVQINNADNPNNVEVRVAGTQYSIEIPAYANGIFPLDALENDVISFYSLGGASALISFTIFNYALPSAVWYTTDPLAPGFDVQALAPIATLVTNRTRLLVAGVAADTFPPIATPNYKWSRNLSDEVIFWNINANATGSVANDFQMSPGEGFNGLDFELMFRTGQRISMYSVNGGRVEAMEWNVS